MEIKIKKAFKSIALYIAQAGALWGLLEGYTYFKGDTLKEFLGSYWFLIYTIPLLTTAYIIVRQARDEETVQESITTQGDFSPGKVGGDYAVRIQPGNLDQTDSLDNTPEVNQQHTSIKKSDKSIHTKGDYSPGEVRGDYTIEE